jgi:hypothetical protein
MDEDRSMKEHPVRKTAFELYQSYSPSREEILQMRQDEKNRLKVGKSLIY